MLGQIKACQISQVNRPPDQESKTTHILQTSAVNSDVPFRVPVSGDQSV